MYDIPLPLVIRVQFQCIRRSMYLYLLWHSVTRTVSLHAGSSSAKLVLRISDQLSYMIPGYSLLLVQRVW